MGLDVDGQIKDLKNRLKEMRNNTIEYEKVKFEFWKRTLDLLQKRKEVIDWLKKTKTKYFVTITFKVDLPNNERRNQIKSILKMLRKEYFGRNKNKDFLKGYVFEEKHIGGLIHFHLLIEDGVVFNNKRNKDKNFSETLKDKCRRMKIKIFKTDGVEYSDKETIDVERGIDIKNYYCDHLEEYLTKSLENAPRDYSFIHPMSYDGYL